MRLLDGKVAVLTGASSGSGIGATNAQTIADETTHCQLPKPQEMMPQMAE